MGGYVLLVFGLLLGLIMIHITRRAKACKDWPTTEGTVTGTSLEPSYNDEGGLIGYIPHVHYDYVVDGKPMSTGTYGIATSTLAPGKAQQLVNRYEHGQKVTVYYNPKQPLDAVICTEFNQTIYLVLVITIGLAAGGLAWIVFG